MFVEDTVVAVPQRGGDHPARRREPRAARSSTSRRCIDDARAAPSNHIVAPGTLDGGDVLKVGDTVYVGRGGRTNAEGVRQLRRILTPLGATVVAVPLTKVLHLKSAVTALPDGTIIGYPPLVDDPAIFPHFLAVPEESGAHVVCLGGGAPPHGRRLPAPSADCSRTSATGHDASTSASSRSSRGA